MPHPFGATMSIEALLSEIRAAFPVVPMPSSEALRFHSDGCLECTYLSEDLEQFRSRSPSAALYRLVHQELSCLSAAGWRWLLPHYLAFCLTPEAEYSSMEIEFLVYNLGPAEQFEVETRARLGLLNRRQIACLVHFLEWLDAHPTWSEYFPENIERAKSFLGKLAA